MEFLMGLMMWIAVMFMAIKGFLFLYAISGLLAFATFLIASPLLPVAGLISCFR